jgi:hypothetical protein
MSRAWACSRGIITVVAKHGTASSGGLGRKQGAVIADLTDRQSAPELL